MKLEADKKIREALDLLYLILDNRDMGTPEHARILAEAIAALDAEPIDPKPCESVVGIPPCPFPMLASAIDKWICSIGGGCDGCPVASKVINTSEENDE